MDDYLLAVLSFLNLCLGNCYKRLSIEEGDWHLNHCQIGPAFAIRLMAHLASPVASTMAQSALTKHLNN
jgi:hypothetical protein